MIGRGKLRFLTTRIGGPGIPAVGQHRFASWLKRHRGCGLAWHRRRRVFIVYRPRVGGWPATYMDLGPDYWPLNGGLLPLVRDVIDWADASMEMDADKALRVYQLQDADKQRRLNRAFIDERFPDFWNDMNRAADIIERGRRVERYFDLAAN